MIARILGLVAAIAMFGSMPARAQAPILIKQYKPKEVVTIDPGAAYILFRADTPGNYYFYREPDEADLADYRARRAAELDKAKRRYATANAAYERDSSNSRRDPRVRLVRPIEPTDENFEFPPIALSNLFDITAGRALMKDPQYVYLIAVRPGTYTLYGVVDGAGGGGPTGVCLCMGSVRFGAVPGIITDLGTVSLEGTQMVVSGVLYIPEPTVKQRVTPTNLATYLPPQVSGLAVRQAELRAAPKMENYFGLFIDRLMPVPGVLAYERDRVIDVRTGEKFP